MTTLKNITYLSLSLMAAVTLAQPHIASACAPPKTNSLPSDSLGAADKTEVPRNLAYLENREGRQLLTASPENSPMGSFALYRDAQLLAPGPVAGQSYSVMPYEDTQAPATPTIASADAYETDNPCEDDRIVVVPSGATDDHTPPDQITYLVYYAPEKEFVEMSIAAIAPQWTLTLDRADDGAVQSFIRAPGAAADQRYVAIQAIDLAGNMSEVSPIVKMNVHDETGCSIRGQNGSSQPIWWVLASFAVLVYRRRRNDGMRRFT